MVFSNFLCVKMEFFYKKENHKTKKLQVTYKTNFAHEFCSSSLKVPFPQSLPCLKINTIFPPKKC